MSTADTVTPVFYGLGEKFERNVNQFSHTAAKMNSFQALSRAKQGRIDGINVDDSVITTEIAERRSVLEHRHRQTQQMSKRPTDDDKFVAAEEKEIAKLNARRHRNAAEKLAIQNDTTGQFERCANWLQEYQDKTSEDGRVFVEVPKGKIAKQMFEATGMEIIAAQGRKMDVVRAPIPIEQVKQNASRDIDRRATKGRIDVRRTFKPHRNAQGRDVIEAIKYPIKHDGNGGGMMDLEATFFNIHKDHITAHVLAQIDAEYDGTGALTIGQRKAAIAKIDAEILHLDRVAEAYLDLAAEDGVTGLVRRPNASPMAILGLKFEGE